MPHSVQGSNLAEVTQAQAPHPLRQKRQGDRIEIDERGRVIVRAGTELNYMGDENFRESIVNTRRNRAAASKAQRIQAAIDTYQDEAFVKDSFLEHAVKNPTILVAATVLVGSVALLML